MSDRIRAEWATHDLYRVRVQLAEEIRKRRAAEAERDAAVAYAGVLEALLEAAEERKCATQCYSALLP